LTTALSAISASTSSYLTMTADRFSALSSRIH